MRIVLVAMAVLSLGFGTARALSEKAIIGCPESRVYLAPQLLTTPKDGKLYEIQRQALAMPIDEVVRVLGGAERAHAIALATRQRAERKIAEGVSDAELRFHRDTILRADALIAILDCRKGLKGA